MGSYRISWKPSARKELRKLHPQAIRRVVQAVESLPHNPHPPGTRKLVGSDAHYRLRVGDYRIIYTIWESLLVIEILRVGHRKAAYKR